MMDDRQIAASILEDCGTSQNIKSMTHCMTRLRFIIKDKSKVNLDKIEKTDKVLGAVYKSDELQIVLGANLMPIYNEVSKLATDINQTQAIDENLDTDKKKEKKTVKSVLMDGLDFVSAAVTPMVPGLIAGGMLKVFLLLVTLVWSGFAKTQTYTLLTILSTIPFIFMPVFVAYGTAKKLGGTVIYPMIVSTALVAPDFLKIVAAGKAISIIGIPVTLVQYQSSMLPALLITVAAYWIEKGMNKIVPGIFKSILVGVGTIVISYIIGITALGPLGDWLGRLVSGGFVWAGNHFGFVALAITAALIPWLTMTGMHHAISPFMTQFIANPGYDGIFRPAFILHNMAEGGATLGVALKTKDKAFRSECISIAIGCVLAGVSEPAIYGVTLKYKKPMIGVMAGGAAGGIVAGLLGAKAYMMGYSSIMALPIFEKTMPAMIAGIIVAIIVSTAVSYALGYESKSESSSKVSQQNTKFDISAPVNGQEIPLEDVKDETFSQKMLGDGVAFNLPKTGKVTVTAPITGTLSAVFPTGHAFGITADNGVEVLVHIGIDTVNANGDGFKMMNVKQGQRITAGDPIVEVDLDKLKKHYDMTTMLIITNPADKQINFQELSNVKVGQTLLA